MIYKIYYKCLHKDKPAYAAKMIISGAWMRHITWTRINGDYDTVMGMLAIVPTIDYGTPLFTPWEDFPWKK